MVRSCFLLTETAVLYDSLGVEGVYDHEEGGEPVCVGKKFFKILGLCL